nr:ferritin-like protein [Chitinophagaceae bacterium]
MHSLFQQNNPKRQKLISSSSKKLLLAKGNGGGIKTIDSLKKHLQVAIELEHSTIPPYLCALYSIKEGTNVAASQIIRSVVIEEMLHM